VLTTDGNGVLSWAMNGSGATGDVLNNGNSFNSVMTLGTNDNFNLNFETNSLPRMTVTSTGNVGIGTTTPTALLDVNGNMMVRNSAEFRNTNGGGVQFLTGGGMDAVHIVSDQFGGGNGGAVRFAPGNGGGYDVRLSRSSANTLVLDNAANGAGNLMVTGNVGIGTTTPGSALDIAGAQSFREMAAPALSPADQGRIYFDSTSNKFRVSENGGAYTDLVGAGGSISGLTTNFITKATSATTVGNSSIYESSGNVGIGSLFGIPNTTPGARLDAQDGSGSGAITIKGYQYFGNGYGIYGHNSGSYDGWLGAGVGGIGVIGVRAISSGTDEGGSALIAQTSTATTSGNLMRLQHRTSTYSDTAFLADMASGSGTFTGNFLDFRNAGSSRMVVTSAGNVGIGTASPETKLDVRGVASASAVTEEAAGYVDISGGGYVIPNASTSVRRINLTGNALITLPAFTSTSIRVFTLTVFLKQDATGSRTVTWAGNGSDTIKWDAGVAPPISANPNKITILQLTKVSDENVWYGSTVWKED
ncbi:MAG: hypothetical protein ACK5V3_17790, partial [Bdellovibrionales bacterium]